MKLVKDENQTISEKNQISDEEAEKKYPEGWRAPKPYLRLVKTPK